jgi:hypothetical protein
MNVKHYFFTLFFILSISIVQATPDRERYIIDRLIGLNGVNIIVHQFVFDNLQNHYVYIQEEYIIEKFMENGNTSIIKQILITEQNTIENILQNEYNGNINYIFPDINSYFFYIQPRINDGYIVIPNDKYEEIPSEGGTRYYIKDHIPKELINCRIMRIVDIYLINEYIYLAIDLKDNINTYRKIIMIKLI